MSVVNNRGTWNRKTQLYITEFYTYSHERSESPEQLRFCLEYFILSRATHSRWGGFCGGDNTKQDASSNLSSSIIANKRKAQHIHLDKINERKQEEKQLLWRLDIHFGTRHVVFCFFWNSMCLKYDLLSL